MSDEQQPAVAVSHPFVGRPGQLWWSSPAEIAKVAVELLTNGTGVTLDQIIEAARDQTAWASFVQTSRTEAANLSP